LPTETFFNLSKEKRNRIVEAAFEEFAEKPFNEASIASIIENAKIPRGSFYQYFFDLKDLYSYLMEQIGQKKLAYFDQIIPELDQLKTVELIRELYNFGIKFARENPRLAAIGNNFYKEDLYFKEEVFKGFTEEAVDFYKKILQRGIQRGEIDERIDSDVTAEMLFYINLYLADNMLEGFNIEDGVLIDNFDGYLKIVDKLLFVIENGISKN